MKPRSTMLFRRLSLSSLAVTTAMTPAHTAVSIVGDEFFINGQPTSAAMNVTGYYYDNEFTRLFSSNLPVGVF
jgi:hypothetical protein